MDSPRLHGLLLAAAERAPASPLYLSDAGEWTYAQVATRAARLARALVAAGVGPGDRVPLVLDGCVEYLVACYGVLMAGAVVVPQSPDTRPRVLRAVLSHCDARAVVIAGTEVRQLAPVLPDLGGLRLVVTVGRVHPPPPPTPPHVDLAELVAAGPGLEDAGASGDALATIGYTSGTTGAPKGAMLSHRNIVANVGSIVSYLGLEATDRAAMVLPYFYVYGSSVLHTHVAAGASIVDAGSMAFPAKVLEATSRAGCTGLSGVPSTFARLVRFEGIERYDLSRLRYVTQAGAAMNTSLTAALRRAMPHSRIFVMYGQTEASARLSYLPPEDLDRKPGSVGIAIPGVTLGVVDAAGAEVPRGEVGEITARGDNVMRGYLGDEEATARALRGGVLHTGDVGRMDEEGFLWIVGRETDMIKSGGHRIGPHEVEEVVCAVPGVAECAVIGLPDALLGEVVAAFVVLDAGASVDARAIQKACHRELPKHKMPTVVRFVDSLPRSDRGKLLRGALRQAHAGDAEPQVEP